MKKKVLFVATVDSHIELFHLPYLKMFKDRGYEVHVATDSDKKIKYCNKKIKLPIKRSPFRFSNLKAIFKLRKIMKAEKYDIVHCHTPMGGVVARLAAKKLRRTGTRVIYTAHGFHFYEGAPSLNWVLYYPVEKWLSKYTDTLITINTEDFERAKEKFRKRCFDIQYVSGVGVDEKKFEKRLNDSQKKALRKSLKLKGDDKVLIFPAELSKRKNQTWLIKALTPLFRANENVHLLLPGKDNLNGKCQKLVERLELQNQVHILGFRDDVSKLFQISDVAISSSKQEGLPVNLMEAAFLGLPIVATDCRGNRDVCEKVGGKLVGQDDALDFIKYIERLTEVAKKRDFSGYALAQVSEDMEEIYFRKKRILHLLASNEFSGAENVACTIIENLSDEFDMAYCSPYGPIEDKLKERNVRFFEIAKLNQKNLKKMMQLYHPDIIHAHDYKATISAALFLGDHMVISHIHKNDPAMRRVSLKSTLFLDLCLANRIAEIVTVSDAIMAEYIFSKYISNKKCMTLPNYVQKDEILKKAREFKVKKKYDVFFFGRLSKEKGALQFIDIVKNMNNPELKCVMIGDGPLRHKCEGKIKNLGLTENIDMVGFQDNPYPYIKAARLGIMPSVFEGFGISAVEATILGKPVFNTGVGGLKNIFKNTGLIVDDANSYNEKIKLPCNLPSVKNITNLDHWKKTLIGVYEQ